MLKTCSGPRPAPPPGSICEFYKQGGFQGDSFKALSAQDQGAADALQASYWNHLSAVLCAGRRGATSTARLRLGSEQGDIVWSVLSKSDLHAVWLEVNDTGDDGFAETWEFTLWFCSIQPGSNL
jgi:hypothetical protein